MPKGQCHTYTEQQLLFIKQDKMLTRKKLTEQFNELFGTTQSVSAIKGLCLRKGWLTGHNGQFKKTNKPWNTGTKGVCKGSYTSFKKDNIPYNLKPLGDERFCAKTGCILIKVAEPNPYTSAKTRYRAKHHVIWEKENGKIPKGSVIRFIDGDNKNCNLKNLSCVSKSVNLRMNKNNVNAMSDELKPTGKLISELEVATFNAIKGNLK